MAQVLAVTEDKTLGAYRDVGLKGNTCCELKGGRAEFIGLKHTSTSYHHKVKCKDNIGSEI